MKKPEVGDTVIIQGIVQHEITDVIPKPWVPQ
jgi:hypothetical protein